MRTTYTLLALAIFAFCGTAMGKHGMFKCLTDEAREMLKNKLNETKKACLEANGIPLPTGAPDKSKPKEHKEPNMCVMDCMWNKDGFAKDGKILAEEFVRAHVKSEFQDPIIKAFQKCLEEKGVTTSYTATKEKNCEDMKPQADCAREAAKVCKGQDGNSSSSE